MNRCLLFDCDGTLVDSERLCAIGLARMFKPLNVALDIDELLNRFQGGKLDNILAALAQQHQLSLPTDFVLRYRELLAQLFETQLKPVQHIEEALKNLPQPKAVVSNGPIDKVTQALRVCGLSEYFGSNIYSAYEIKIWKPNPGLYQYAAQQMGFSAQECIVIDDTLLGVKSGIEAGMNTYFYNPHKQSCNIDSVVNFNSMSQLVELLKT